MARTKKDAKVSGGERGWSHTQRWDPAIVAKCADLARRGFSRGEAADYLGIPRPTLKYWWQSHPELREAVNAARSEPAPHHERGGSGGCRSGETLQDYIFGRLDPDLQAVWRRIEDCDRAETPLETVEKIMADQGETARQKLWLHAWMGCRFNKSEACRRTATPHQDVRRWMGQKAFGRLAEQMMEIQKDWAQACLFNLAPDNAAVAIFLNRCLNRDRGFDPKVGVEHTGTVSHELVEAEELSALTLEQRRELLAAVRAKSKALPPRQGVIIDQGEGEVPDEGV